MTKLSTKFAQVSKRAIALVSSVTIVITGLVAGVAAPANATSSYVSNSGSVASTWSIKKYFTDPNSITFTVPSGATGLNFSVYATTGTSYGSAHTLADSLVGKAIGLTGVVYDSSNNPVTTGLYANKSQGAFTTGTGYPTVSPANCQAPGPCTYTANSSNAAPTYFYLNYYANYQPVATGNAFVVGGTYSIQMGYTLDGVAQSVDSTSASADTGFPLNAGQTYVAISGTGPIPSSYTGWTLTYYQSVCSNVSGLTSADSLTARWIQDDSVAPNNDIYAPNKQWYPTSQSGSQISNYDAMFSNNATTMALTTETLVDGPRVTMSRQITLDGNTHTFDLSIQDQNGNEISRSCAPNAPGKPSISAISSTTDFQLSIPRTTQIFGYSSDANGYKDYVYEIFNSQDLSTRVFWYTTTTNVSTDSFTANASTNYRSPSYAFIAGESYQVRVKVTNTVTSISSAWSPISDPFTVTGPAAMSTPTLSLTSLTQANVTFTPVTGSTNYKAVIYADADHSTPVFTNANCYASSSASSATCNLYPPDGTLRASTNYVATIAAQGGSWWGTPSPFSSTAQYAPPAAPTNVAINTNTSNAGSIAATFSTVTGASSYTCYLYSVNVSATPHVVSSSSITSSSTPSGSCTLTSSSLIAGSTVVVKVKATISGVTSDFSSASNEFVVPAATWTLGTPLNRGNYMGAVNVRSNVADLTSASSATTTITSNLLGDAYKSSFSIAGTPPAQTATVSLKKIKSSTYNFDSAFGNNGEVTFTVPSDATVMSAPVISAFADGRWVTSFSKVGGYYVYEGNASGLGSNYTPMSLTSTDLATWCNASQTDFTAQSVGINFVSGLTNRPLVTVTCRQTPSVSSPSVQLLAKLAADGTLTKVVQLTYTNGTWVNGSTTVPLTGVVVPMTGGIGSVQYSSNPNASSDSDVALVAWVVDTTTPGPSGGVVGDRRLIRVTKAGNATTTHMAYSPGTDNTTVAEPMVRLASSFDGSTVFAVTSSYSGGGPNTLPTETVTLLKATTGGFDSANNLTLNMDKASDWSMYQGAYYIGGAGFAPNSGGYLQMRRSIVGGNTSPIMNAIAKINLSTGAVTTGEMFVASRSATSLYLASWMSNTGNYFLALNPSTANPPATSFYEFTNAFAPAYVAPSNGPTVMSTAGSLFAKNVPVSGTTLTFNGTNLDAASVTGVKFGTVNATIKTPRSATALTVIVPSGSVGQVPITLVTASGMVNAGTFTYTGVTGATQTVTVTGAGAATANVGDADRTVSATVVASVPGAETSATVISSTPSVCTLISGTLHFVSNGVCTIKGSAAGSNWASSSNAAPINIAVSALPVITSNESTPVSVSDSQYYIPATSTSDGVLRYTVEPSNVCVLSSDADTPNLVSEVAAGVCTISIVQEASPASFWLAVNTPITYTVSFTTAVTDPNAAGQASTSTTPSGDSVPTDAAISALNPATLAAVVLPANGTWKSYQEVGLSWTRSSGSLKTRVKSTYVGPITSTIAFTSGGKKYTCKVSYGNTKAIKGATTARTVTSTGICGGTSATDKKALPLLKALPIGTKIVVVTTVEKRRSVDYKLKKGKNRFVFKNAIVLK